MLRVIEYYWAKFFKKIRGRAFFNVKIDNTSKVHAGAHLVNVSVGKYSDIGYDATILNTDIGAFCSFGFNVVIGGAAHTLDWVSTSTVFNENKDSIAKKFSKHKFSLDSHTIIGNDVWIGNQVQIKANVKVADGAVIGMGSVVTKDVGPYEIWAGNPAKLIRKRFDDETIQRLLNVKWWLWEDRKIEFYASYFDDIQSFLQEVEKDNFER
ncbi:CatB-related O-acetyltransferase [Capnocytophaga canimorsus]|uniref:CatB-related O-acetyltransferase n=1 Tax=Capnocytophaga canimorsus TaxID=28188 RepID=UPI001EE06016|nr:CatB-related O-acetyltransferase [Capnocytophaga canimorsus]GJQ03946.1 hypothetical protein CAPN009_03610 [Capnocytophaga canimorsus]